MYRIRLFPLYCLLVLVSCKKNEQDRSFYGDAKVFFASHNASDSLVHSFANNVRADDKELLLPLNIMGSLSGTDRSVDVVVEPDGTTALSTEYELAQAIVPANSATGYVPIKLINSPRLEAEQVQLTLRVRTSPDFLVEPGETVKTREITRFRVIWTNILNRPTDWPIDWGAYSKVKHRLVIDLTGHFIYSGTEWTAGGFVFRVLGACNEWLEAYNAANPLNPYRDENGRTFRFCRTCN